MRRFLLDERDPHAAVLLAFFLDIRHGDVADFARIFNMCAAAGLQIQPDNIDEADTARSHWWLD